MTSIKRTARVAGGLYLFIALCGGFAFFAGFESFISPGDATATVNNILASEFIFRVGAVADSFTFLAEIVLTILLYILFKPVSKVYSTIAAFSRLAMTIMIGMNLLNKLVVLQLLSGAGYLTVFEPNQLNALVMIFLNAYSYGSLIWGIFFALHLLIIGYLIVKATFFPGVFGILFIIAGLGYFIDSIGHILFPQYDALYTLVIMATIPAELLFALWLTIKGIKVESWEKCALEYN